MAPLDPTVFIDPLDLSEWTNPPGGIDPGFTQDVIDILGNQGSPADGFDQAAADTGAVVDALDAVLGEQDAALDAILAEHQASDPGQLDLSMQGYVSTFPTGDSIVTATGGLAVPDLLELPMSSAFDTTITGAPRQVTHDFGTVKLGAPAIQYHLGTQTLDKLGSHGLLSPVLANGDPRIFNILEVDHIVETRNVNSIDYYLLVRPVAAGAFTAQVNTINAVVPGYVIWTFTVTVAN